MKKITKRVFVLILVWSMSVSSFACGKSSKGEQEKENSADSVKMSYGEVWAAPSTVLINQDETDYNNKKEAAFSYKMVRNEYESYQLLITAEKDISSFELKATDLKSGTRILSADNIKVYVQKYVEYADTYGSGSSPDPLIPMDAAKEYGENKIAKGVNGGFWVTIYTPKETEPGIYEGEFELTVEGDEGKEVMNIPVSVEVTDYTLTDDVTAGTLFSWRYSRTSPGELDGSIEMMEYYYEWFLDYRISLESLPLESLNGEEFVESLLKYYDKISNYTILSAAGDIARNIEKYPERVTEQVLAIAAACTPERNLFDKATLYMIDEPQVEDEASVNSLMTRLRKAESIFQECVATIKADKTDTYAGIKQNVNWEKSILEIPNVMPITYKHMQFLIDNQDVPYVKEFLDTITGICPIFTVFQDKFQASLKDRTFALCEKYDIELWWYNAGINVNGATCYNIANKNLLDKRTGAWMRKKYDIAGNLYWNAVASTEESKALDEYINIYERPYHQTHYEAVAGDGFVCYPGAPYGVYGPLPSLRLMSIRDGQEDYEILSDIENKINVISDSFGDDFSVEEAMDYFYDQISYEGFKLYSDGTNGLDFTALRSSLLDLATNLDVGTGLVMGKVVISGNTAAFDFYTQAGLTVTVDGQAQTPISGTRYHYVQDLTKSTTVTITVTDANGRSAVYRQYLGNAVYDLNTFADKSVMEGIKVSENSSAEWVSGYVNASDGTAVRFNITGNVTGDMLQDTAFVPYFSIAGSLLSDIKLSELSVMRMEMYNPGEEVTVKIRFYSGSNYYDFGDYNLENGNTSIELKMEGLEFSELDNVDRIAVEFHEYENSGNLVTHELYLDNIVATKLMGGNAK